MSSNKKSVNVERRTWDVAAYEEKALARQQQQQEQDNGIHDDKKSSHHFTSDDNNLKEEFTPAPVGAMGPEGSQRAYLQARKRKVADFIDDRVGSTTLISMDDAVGTKKNKSSVEISSTTDPLITTESVITKSSSSGSGGVGFHCNVCDCYLKDSLTYLDHVNGRKHQRKLGYTMRVERSTESDVLTRLNELKKVKQQGTSVNDNTDNIDYNKIVQEKDGDEERRREERQRLRKERRKRHNHAEIEPPVMKVVEVVQNIKDDQHHQGDVKVDDDDDEEEEPVALIDPAMAAMMGFTGFGGT